MPKRIPFSEQIRRAVLADGRTRYRIAKESAIDQSAISRFVNRKGGLQMDGLDRLADVLGLNVAVTPRQARR